MAAKNMRIYINNLERARLLYALQQPPWDADLIMQGLLYKLSQGTGTGTTSHKVSIREVNLGMTTNTNIPTKPTGINLAILDDEAELDRILREAEEYQAKLDAERLSKTNSL